MLTEINLQGNAHTSTTTVPVRFNELHIRRRQKRRHTFSLSKNKNRCKLVNFSRFFNVTIIQSILKFVFGLVQYLIIYSKDNKSNFFEQVHPNLLSLLETKNYENRLQPNNSYELGLINRNCQQHLTVALVTYVCKEQK